jgi:hypothetical protein
MPGVSFIDSMMVQIRIHFHSGVSHQQYIYTCTSHLLAAMQSLTSLLHERSPRTASGT